MVLRVIIVVRLLSVPVVLVVEVSQPWVGLLVISVRLALLWSFGQVWWIPGMQVPTIIRPTGLLEDFVFVNALGWYHGCCKMLLILVDYAFRFL